MLLVVFGLAALWTLVRLLIPALILTRGGLINHTVTYHVAIPWDEIEEFTWVSLGDGKEAVNSISVHVRNELRISALQGPLTRLLMHLYRSLIPTNIEMKMISGTPEAVWAQLQAYVHRTIPDQEIKFSTLH